MNKFTRIALVILALIQLVREIGMGIPLVGGLYIASTGWVPLVNSFIIYGLMALILFIDERNEIRGSIIVPIAGLVGTALAFIPFIGWFVHVVMICLVLGFLFAVFTASNRVGNTTKYNPYNGRETVGEQYNRRK